MKLELALAMLLAVSAADAAQMYRWVDEHGVTHFSQKRPDQSDSGPPTLQGGTTGSAPADPSSGSGSSYFSGSTRLTHGGWQDCDSEICRLAKQLDPDCATALCSDAKRYSDDCHSLACQTNRVAFERNVRDQIARQEALSVPPPKRVIPEPPRAPTKRADD